MSDDNPLSPPPSRPKEGCGTVILWVAIAAVLSGLVTLAAVWLLSLRVTDEIRAFSEGVADRFEAALQIRPEVRVDGIVVVEGSSPILEVATAQKELLARYRWSHTHLYSTKTIEIEAPFIAKAGFSLEEPLRIRVDPRTRELNADFPSPRLLSLEMGDPKILTDEDGFWNKLTAADREEAFRELRASAVKKLEASNFLGQARRETEARFRELLAPVPPD